jgi:peptide-methionine (S)-S-oxide reductase
MRDDPAGISIRQSGGAHPFRCRLSRNVGVRAATNAMRAAWNEASVPRHARHFSMESTMNARACLLNRASGRTSPVAALAVALLAALALALPAHAETAVAVPPPTIDLPAPAGAATETLVLAGGCFWGVQGVFQHVTGVRSAVSGYAGGSADTATYPKVGSGTTGHAESVRVVYDPGKISYGRLLQIYFSVAHDPTELNRQGPDQGTQYRSTIFAANAEQSRVARSYIDQLNRAKTFGKPLATTIEPLKGFYPAESYHQDFLTLNPRYPYIVYNDLPKIEALKRLFPADYRAQPVLVGAAAP